MGWGVVVAVAVAVRRRGRGRSRCLFSKHVVLGRHHAAADPAWNEAYVYALYLIEWWVRAGVFVLGSN